MKRLPYRSCCKRAAIRAFDKGGKTCDSLMTGAQGSTRETSSMIITFPRDEGERSAGSQLKEGQTG
jgi:hypothetical protein